MAFYSGCNGRVIINGTTLKARKWSVNSKCDELDVTNFESGGGCFADFIGGVKEAEVSMEALWDDVDDPFTNPPIFFPATVVTNVSLYLIKNDNAHRWLFPSMLVSSCSMDTEVRGVITYTIALKSKGSFTGP